MRLGRPIARVPAGTARPRSEGTDSARLTCQPVPTAPSPFLLGSASSRHFNGRYQTGPGRRLLFNPCDRVKDGCRVARQEADRTQALGVALQVPLAHPSAGIGGRNPAKAECNWDLETP